MSKRSGSGAQATPSDRTAYRTIRPADAPVVCLECSGRMGVHSYQCETAKRAWGTLDAMDALAARHSRIEVHGELLVQAVKDLLAECPDGVTCNRPDHDLWARLVAVVERGGTL